MQASSSSASAHASPPGGLQQPPPQAEHFVHEGDDADTYGAPTYSDYSDAGAATGGDESGEAQPADSYDSSAQYAYGDGSHGGEQQRYDAHGAAHADPEEEVNPFEAPGGVAGAGDLEGGHPDGAAAPEQPEEGGGGGNDGIPDDDGAAFEHRKLLYALHTVSAWTDRIWEFASVVFLMSMYPTSLFYTALFGLSECVASVAFAKRVERKLDTGYRRLDGVRWALLAQHASVVTGAVVFWMALHDVDLRDSAAAAAIAATTAHVIDPITGRPAPLLSPGPLSSSATPGWFGLGYLFLLCVGVTGKLASVGARGALQADWLPLVAGGSAERREVLHAQLRLLEVAVSIVAPLLLGIISSLGSGSAAAAVLLFLSVVLFGASWYASGALVKAVPSLARKPGVDERLDQARAAQEADEAAGVGSVVPSWGQVNFVDLGARAAPATLAAVERGTSWLAEFRDEQVRFRAHPAWAASVSLVLLHVSVLWMGPTMISWLKGGGGLSDAVLGLLRALAITLGVGGARALPGMVQRWGSLRAALLALSWHAVWLVVVVICCLTFFSDSKAAQLGVLLACLLASLPGLRAFEVANSEVLNEQVAAADAVLFVRAQRSLIHIARAASFLLTVIFVRPSWFAVPALASFGCVLVAALLYARWARETLKTANPFPSLQSFKPGHLGQAGEGQGTEVHTAAAAAAAASYEQPPHDERDEHDVEQARGPTAGGGDDAHEYAQADVGLAHGAPAYGTGGEQVAPEAQWQ